MSPTALRPPSRTPLSHPWRGRGEHGGASRLSGNNEAMLACRPPTVTPQREQPRVNKRRISVAHSSLLLGGEHVGKRDTLKSRDSCGTSLRSLAVSPGRLMRI